MKRKVLYTDLAEYYDLIVSYKDTKSEIEFLENIFKKFGKIRSILDLSCGTGRHAIPLSRKGYVVTGLDINESMLEVARRKSTKVRWIRSDMRNMKFESKFDAAICMWTSINYMLSREDLARAIIQTHKALRHKGLFIIDMPNPLQEKTKESLKTCDNKKTRIIIRWKKKIDGIFRKNNFEYTVIDKESGKVRFFKEKDTERLWTYEEMKEVLDECGFNVLLSVGDFTLLPYSEESDRLIIVARKKSYDITR